MRVTRLFVLLLVVLTFSVSIIKAPSPQSALAASGSTTVYITTYGKCYHTAYCQYLNKSSVSISLSTAIKKGYRRCSACNPPYLTDDYDEDETRNNNNDKYNGTRAEKANTSTAKIVLMVIICVLAAVGLYNIVAYIVDKIESKKMIIHPTKQMTKNENHSSFFCCGISYTFNFYIVFLQILVHFRTRFQKIIVVIPE